MIKISKHGIIIIHVPGKEIYFDLTIHMDVQANPGTFTYPNYDCLLANSFHFPSTDGASKFHYTCEQLISLRPSGFSTKCLTPQLIRCLKDLKILKYRGKSGGTRANNEVTRIPVINKRRNIAKYNSNRRVNLHNLCSLKRCSKKQQH